MYFIWKSKNLELMWNLYGLHVVTVFRMDGELMPMVEAWMAQVAAQEAAYLSAAMAVSWKNSMKLRLDSFSLSLCNMKFIPQKESGENSIEY